MNGFLDATNWKNPAFSLPVLFILRQILCQWVSPSIWFIILVTYSLVFVFFSSLVFCYSSVLYLGLPLPPPPTRHRRVWPGMKRTGRLNTTKRIFQFWSAAFPHCIFLQGFWSLLISEHNHVDKIRLTFYCSKSDLWYHNCSRLSSSS